MKKKFEQLANGGKLRLAYRSHEVHIFKEYHTDLCGLMICVLNPEQKVKRYSGIILKGDISSKAYLVTMTEVESNLLIFSALVEFILERLTRIDSVDFESVHKIIEEWRAFTRGEPQTIAFSTQIGLFGELLFFRELLENKGGEFAVFSWTGPEKAKTDFILSTRHAVEIKSSKDPLGNEVSISSLEQLSSTFEYHFLRRYGLVETVYGDNLRDIFFEIYREIDGFDLKDTFRSKVLDYGFNPFVEYDNLLKLEQATLVDYDVNQTGFPKIISPVHEKISKLSYTINLDSQQKLDETYLFASLNW